MRDHVDFTSMRRWRRRPFFSASARAVSCCSTGARHPLWWRSRLHIRRRCHSNSVPPASASVSNLALPTARYSSQDRDLQLRLLFA